MGEGKRKEKGKGREAKARRGQAGRRQGGRVRAVDAGNGSDSEAFGGGGACQSSIIHHFGAICKETKN